MKQFNEITGENHEAILEQIKELGLEFLRFEDVIFIDGIYIRHEVLAEFVRIMKLSEKLEQS